MWSVFRCPSGGEFQRAAHRPSRLLEAAFAAAGWPDTACQCGHCSDAGHQPGCLAGACPALRLPLLPYQGNPPRYFAVCAARSPCLIAPPRCLNLPLLRRDPAAVVSVVTTELAVTVPSLLSSRGTLSLRPAGNAGDPAGSGCPNPVRPPLMPVTPVQGLLCELRIWVM